MQSSWLAHDALVSMPAPATPRRVSEHVIAWHVPVADPDGRRRSFTLHHSAQARLELGINGAVHSADDTLPLSTSDGVRPSHELPWRSVRELCEHFAEQPRALFMCLHEAAALR